jgi:hypothetical protein
VVEETIAGRGDHLKERILGAVVFGRDPDYDVSQDNVVRASAGEIRRRILEYNARPDHNPEITIELASGFVCSEI